MNETRDGILIWGAGAIGGSVGAHLARVGHRVTMVDTSVAHIKAIQEKGLTIVRPADSFTIELPAFTPDELQGRWRLVMLAVKAQHTAAATEALADHLDEAGGVLSLQNGLSAEVIASRFGRERTYLALGSVAADVLGPGEIRFGSSVTMPVGQIDGRGGGMLDEIVATLQEFEPRTFGAPDIQDYMWGKHCFNTLTSATAAGLSPMAVLIGREDLRPVWRGLYREVLAIAFAQGIKPRPFGPYDPMAFAPDAPPEAEEKFIHTLATGPTNKSKPHSGMWRDLAIHHRQTEVAALLAPIARVGDGRGLKTSLLHGVVGMIGEIEQGRRTQDDANLVELLQYAG